MLQGLVHVNLKINLFEHKEPDWCTTFDSRHRNSFSLNLNPGNPLTHKPNPCSRAAQRLCGAQSRESHCCRLGWYGCSVIGSDRLKSRRSANVQEPWSLCCINSSACLQSTAWTLLTSDLRDSADHPSAYGH